MNRVKEKIFAIVFLALIFFSPIAGANEYQVRMESELKTNYGWSSVYSFLINESETEELPGSVSLYFKDYNPSNSDQVWLTYSPTEYENGDLLMSVGQQVCIRDDDENICVSDPRNASIGTIRLKLVKIIEEADPSPSVVFDEDSVVSVYVVSTIGEELYIPNNKNVSYNPVTYNEKTGWTVNSIDDEITMYVVKKVNTPMSVTMNSLGRWTEESTTDRNTKKYLLENNGKYTITVDYEREDSWGKIMDETNTYVVTIEGLKTSSPVSNVASSKTIIPAPYDLIVNKWKDFEFSEGDFINVPDTIETQKGSLNNGIILWKIRLTEVGLNTATYKYKTGDEVQVNFRGKGEEVGETKTSTASQKQGETSSERIYAIGGILVLVIISLFVFMTRGRRRKKVISNDVGMRSI